MGQGGQKLRLKSLRCGKMGPMQEGFPQAGRQVPGGVLNDIVQKRRSGWGVGPKPCVKSLNDQGGHKRGGIPLGKVGR